jgi:hypothetical protein
MTSGHNWHAPQTGTGQGDTHPRCVPGGWWLPVNLIICGAGRGRISGELNVSPWKVPTCHQRHTALPIALSDVATPAGQAVSRPSFKRHCPTGWTRTASGHSQ